MKKFILLILAIIIAGGGYYYFFVSNNAEVATTSYEYIKIEKGNIKKTVSATGKIIPTSTLTLSSEISGKIVEINKDYNDQISKGEVLAIFDQNPFTLNVKESQTSVDISKSKLKQKQASLEKAKSELRIAELNVERCQIKAPFDGAVEEVVVNTYETIQPQVELMKIIQTEVLELEMVVSSEWISWLKIGHPIKVYIDEIQKEFNATISGIGANVDAVSQTIQLKGTITDTSPALLPGMSGRVVF